MTPESEEVEGREESGREESLRLRGFGTLEEEEGGLGGKRFFIGRGGSFSLSLEGVGGLCFRKGLGLAGEGV